MSPQNDGNVEWVVVYLQMGVSKIVIYDDSYSGTIMQKRFHEALKPFQDAGYVDLLPIDPSLLEKSGIIGRQAYLQLTYAQNHSEDLDWIAYFDQDEFLYIRDHQCLNDVLSDYAEFGGIALPWRNHIFRGVSVHNVRKLHSEQYFYSSPRASMVKSIVQPKYVAAMHVHYADYTEGKKSVNWKKEDNFGSVYKEEFFELDPPPLFQLKHYYIGDARFSIFEKSCGQGLERAALSGQRFNMVVNSLTQESVFDSTIDEELTKVIKDFLGL